MEPGYYYKQCCDEHCGTCVSFNSGFLGVYAQQWDCWFFALIGEEGFLSLLAILWNSAFKCVYLSFSPLPFVSLLFSANFKASSDNHFAFLHFFFLEMLLNPVQCHGHLSIVLWALYQIYLLSLFVTSTTKL